jgi:PucR-like helix-turn-helix protein/diguanylate cyclase with GGDEF domain
MAESPKFSEAMLLTSHNALLDAFERQEGAVAAAMRRAVMAEVADYPASGEPGMLAEVQEHAREHLRVFVACARRGRQPRDEELDFVHDRAVGRERDGMPLAAVLHAYRVGLREVWRALVALAGQDETPPETVLEVTALALGYTDTISIAVTDAYARAAHRRRADVERERRDLLEDLLAGREVDRRAEELGFDLRTPLAVVVAGPPATTAPRSGAAVPGPAGAPGDEAPEPETLRRAAHAIERQAGSAPRPAFVVLHHGHLVALAPIGRGGVADLRSRVARALSALARAGHDGLAAGISLPVTTLAGAAHGHIEATRAHRHAPAGTVVALGDVRLLDYLLEHAGETAHRLVPTWAATLGPELIATLRTFAASDLNVARTAPALNLHPNTVRYRLDRVLTLTGRDPRRFLDLVDLLAAVALSPAD